MLNIKMVKPMFTKIITTCDKYEDDQKNGSIVNTQKLAGTVKEYQKVVAVGTSVRDIEVGDIVMINPIRYAVMKHNEGSLKNGVIADNAVLGYDLPVIELNGVPHLKLESADVEFIITDYDEVEEEPVEKTLEQRAFEAGIYTPTGMEI